MRRPPRTLVPASPPPFRAEERSDAPAAPDRSEPAPARSGATGRAGARTPMRWTPSQHEALVRAKAFFAGEGDAFVLDGPAGTGKTTLLGQILSDLPEFRSVHLAAPTARAARVLRQKSGRDVGTLHSLLYRVEPLKNRPGLRCIPKPNEDTARTLLVVDEASMVASVRPTGDTLFEATRSLLDDVLAYVRGGPGGGQVLFVGDPRQLPPVHESFSAALCAKTLRRRYTLVVGEARLHEVVRQEEGSRVLEAAGLLRAALDAGAPLPALSLPTLGGRARAVRAYLDASGGASTPFDAVHLAFANKLVQGFNADVRRALGRREPLERGDLVTLDADAWVQVRGSDGALRTVQIVRGTAYDVLEVGRERVQREDLTFCTATLRACGEPDAPPFEHRVCLDHLHAPGTGLDMVQETALYAHAMAYNPQFRTEPHPKNDEWVGALRLRFAYALTGHKAQGSEWGHVQVNPWMHPSRAGTPEHLRWLYTVVTRARESLCLA